MHMGARSRRRHPEFSRARSRLVGRPRAVHEAGVTANRPPRPGPRPRPRPDNKPGLLPAADASAGPAADPSDNPGAGGLTARSAALDLVRAAMARRAGLDEGMNHPSWKRLKPQDRAFARALAMATLRNLGRINRALEGKLKKRPPDPVMELLRVGAAQLVALEVPDFAAVATTVKLSERSSDTRPYKGLINAVLRGLIRDGGIGAPAEASLPPWLWERWKATFGDADARSIAEAVIVEPPTDLSLKPGQDVQAWADKLEAEPLPGGGLRVRRRGDLALWPGFETGEWWVQDAAAAVPARLTGAAPGMAIADLCAAPGGKTLQLCAAGAAVTAVDRSPQRLKRLHDNLARAGLTAEVIAADAEAWDDPRTFDAVLLDAPCSATGTFRRNPEVLWGARPAEIAKLADVQHRLLDAAAARVKPGGVLVYCVCSLEREEGETQAIAFVRRHPDFRMEPIDPEGCGAPAEAARPEGWLRILPGYWTDRGGVDGFFVARFQRG